MAMSAASKMSSRPGSALDQGWPSTSRTSTWQASAGRQRPIARRPSTRSQPAGLSPNLRRARRVMAWSGLMAIAIAFAVLLQDFAASAFVTPTPAELSGRCQAALAAGDNERESFLVHLCDGGIREAGTSSTLNDAK